MADARDIPSDVALEIGDDLEPSRFLTAIREFFALTAELAALPGAGNGVPWRVQVRSGSNIVALNPARAVDATVLSAALQRLREGAAALVSGQVDAPVLTEKALRHAKALSDVARDDDRTIPIRLWILHEPTQFGAEVADHIRAHEDTSYADFGTLEGTLKAIAETSGSLEIKIHDPVWPRPIPCRVREDAVEEAIGAFRKRVEVAGMIRYNRHGWPVRIDVETLAVLPDDAALPSAADVRGLLVDVDD